MKFNFQRVRLEFLCHITSINLLHGVEAHLTFFSSKEFQAQSDGDIYYKTMFGKDEMPAYEKKVTVPADQWALVAYMRTMKK